MEREQKLFVTVFTYCLGTFLEFLDFALYASAATIFSLKFFSNISSELALLCSWGVFSISFLVRPLGGILLGPLGDKYGTKKLIVLSLVAMSISTVLIGLLPSYDSIGVLAPIALVLLRIIQGFSVSIEYNGLGSHLMSTEKASGRLGFICSFTSFAVIAGLLFGSVILGLFISNATIEEIPDWQWRLPYVLCGLTVGVTGIYLRLKIPSEKAKISVVINNPVIEMIKKQKTEVVCIILITGFISIAAYLELGFLSTFLHQFKGYYLKEALLLTGVCGIGMLITVPIGGYLSDKHGRLPFMKMMSLISILISIAAFLMIGYGDGGLIVLGSLMLSITIGLIAGPLPALVVENFNVRNRYTASTFAYNAGVSWLGSTAPIIILFLMSKFKMNVIPGLYLSIFATLSYLSAQALINKLHAPGSVATKKMSNRGDKQCLAV